MVRSVIERIDGEGSEMILMAIPLYNSGIYTESRQRALVSGERMKDGYMCFLQHFLMDDIRMLCISHFLSAGL
jgi:hypothetical protein